jgi:FPC/CPF motif-containing protein YcgG
MALIFQPRILFTDPGTGKPLSMQVRRSIHRRMRAYDGFDVHPDIGIYGSPENREWKQYVLPDDNSPTPGTCPLHARRR